MNRELAKKVADAVLYEGYMLYPYRASALKNRQRWSFGILYPPAYPEVACGTERSGMHSECLLERAGDPAVEVELRFLQMAVGEVEEESWRESIERCVRVGLDPLGEPIKNATFAFPSNGETAAARVSRTQSGIRGSVSVSSEKIRDGISKLIIGVANESSLPPGALDRDAALSRCLLSAHLILTVTGAEFVSLLEPPDELREIASSCKNVGNFPVLVGSPEERDIMLCSPIVLYDYPQIAPESAGDFYDATEMDEMLTLRVMTLTDEEKKEMRLAGDHARNLLQRTEQTARQQLMRTHGTIRSLRPVSEKP